MEGCIVYYYLFFYFRDAAKSISCTIGCSLNITHCNGLSILYSPIILYCSPYISGRAMCFGYTIRVSILNLYCAIYLSKYSTINWVNRYDPTSNVAVAEN